MLVNRHALATAVLAATLIAEVSAGLHANGLSGLVAQRRRHHERALLPNVQGKRIMHKRAEDCDEGDAAPAQSCSDGQWQCSGSSLQVCDHGAWITMQDCSATGLVCSVSSSVTGCVWSWQVPSGASSPSAANPSAGDDDEDCTDDDDDNDDITATPVQASSQASQPAPTPAPAINPAASAPAASANASPAASAASASGSPAASAASASASPAASAASGYDNSYDLYTSALASASAAANGATPVASNGASATVTDAPESTIGGNLFAPGSGGKKTSQTSSASASDGDDDDDDDWNTSTDGSNSLGASSTTDQWGASSTDDGSVSATSSTTRGGHRHTATAFADAGASASASMTVTTTSKKTSKTGGSSSNPPSSGKWTAPHHVIYADNWLTQMPSADSIGQYNRFILAFWMSGGAGAVDDAQAWEQFDEEYRQQVLDEYHTAGIALMVSAFGSTDSPTSSGQDPAQTAQDLAAWVKQYNLDGVDIDYEDMNAFNNQQGEDWIITFQQTLRSLLPSGQYVISHAPVAPWFTSAPDYAKGGYKTIHEQAGSGIDWYNVQYYNQGDDQYVDCDTLINQSGSEWPGTSVMELNSLVNIPLEKIVIGKPNNAGAASNGFMGGSSLAKCVAQAQQQGWNGGVMFWEWDNAVTELLAAVLN